MSDVPFTTVLLSAAATTEGPDSAEVDVTMVTSGWVWIPITWSWWVILQMIAALLGVVGNFLVVTVLFQRRKKCRSTDTLVGALAIADLFTSIFMIPLPSAVRVPSSILGELYCRVVNTSLLMWMSVVASILTLTFIPVGQYIAVLYPFRSKHILSRRKVLVVILVIWTISFMLNLVFVFNGRLDKSNEKCGSGYQSKKLQKAMGTIHFIVKFLIPTFLTLTLQAFTARSLHLQSRLHQVSGKRLDISNPSTRHLIAKKRVLQTMFIVVIVFITCWGPDQIIFLGFNFKIVPVSYLYSPFYRVITLLGFCNSCANPIIYAIRYPEIRQAMKDLFTPAKRSAVPLFDERESKPYFQRV